MWRCIRFDSQVATNNQPGSAREVNQKPD
jgi:hypothetical protein